MSDEVAPLVYPPGGHPREMFMFVSYGEPEPVPPLGRRILPWHLAGIFEGRDSDEWNALTRYATALETATSKNKAAWVQVQEQPDSAMQIHAGLQNQTLFNVALKQEAQGTWGYKSRVFECSDDGGLTVISTFPPPAVENPFNRPSSVIGAAFTFYRTTDGSLVALEEAYTGVGGGNMVFNKWWRWRQIK